MTPPASSSRARALLDAQRCAAVAVVALAGMLPAGASAQNSPRAQASAPVAPVAPSRGSVSVKAPVEQGVRWTELKPAQQASLKPLEQDWPRIDAPQKQKWLQVANGFPKRSPAEQTRIQARMADWAKLTPEERGQARLNFQEAVQLPSQDRQARWDAYQALSPEQQRQLAARAAPGSTASGPDAMRKGTSPEARPVRADTFGGEHDQTKSNIVPNPALAGRPKPVSPTVVQASPGATTTAISKRPTPPPHQQAGMPKIAATPEFVDRATLLPQRGPQGAAIRTVPASTASPAQRQ